MNQDGKYLAQPNPHRIQT